MQLLVNRLVCIGSALFCSIASAGAEAGLVCDYDSIRTADIIMCNQSAYDQADLLLNEQYKALLGDLNQIRRERLRVIQREWVEVKESHCQAVYDATYPGVEAGIDRLGCLSNLTMMRVGELSYLRTGVESDGYAQALNLVRDLRISPENKSVPDFLKGVKEPSKGWGSYASNHCSFVAELFKEDFDRCMLRMRFQMIGY